MEYTEVADPKSLRDMENAAAAALETAARIDYVALMAGIEFPDDDEEETDDRMEGADDDQIG